jgi:hypothetical protein
VARYRIYRWTGSAWALFSQGFRNTDGAGVARLAWRFTSPGRWYVRVIADPTVSNADSVWSQGRAIRRAVGTPPRPHRRYGAPGDQCVRRCRSRRRARAGRVRDDGPERTRSAASSYPSSARRRWPVFGRPVADVRLRPRLCPIVRRAGALPGRGAQSPAKATHPLVARASLLAQQRVREFGSPITSARRVGARTGRRCTRLRATPSRSPRCPRSSARAAASGPQTGNGVLDPVERMERRKPVVPLAGPSKPGSLPVMNGGRPAQPVIPQHGPGLLPFGTLP